MKRSTLIRLGILIFLVGTFLILGTYTPLGEWFNLDNVARAIRSAGVWGVLLFVVLCCIGAFLQVPAMLFVLVAILVYGQWTGTLIGFVGSIIAMVFNFYFARFIGGQSIESSRTPFIQKMLTHLGDRPIRTVIMLRLVLWASPFLNMLLAMTEIRAIDYIVGSILGSILPFLVFSLLVLFFRESVMFLF